MTTADPAHSAHGPLIPPLEGSDLDDYVLDLIEPFVGECVTSSSFTSGTEGIVTLRGPAWAMARLVGKGGETINALRVILRKVTRCDVRIVTTAEVPA